MIQFPETAAVEWDLVADAANVEKELRLRIERDTVVEGELEKLRIRHEAKVAFENELSAEDTPALEMMTLASYNSNPALAPSDLIEGVLKDNGLCIMTGPSGSGKSTLALQTLYSLMTGADWLGQKVPKPITGAVGIVSYDMDGPLVMDWMSGYPGIDPNKVSLINAYKRGNPLNVPHMRKQIADKWRSEGVEVVMIDSFSASFFGMNQNDIAETMAHYRDLIKFALTEVGARAISVIAHSTDGNPGKIRGASSHHDVADSIVAVDNDKVTGVRKIHMAKYRSHRGVNGMTHMMNPVVITAPDSVTNLVDLDISGMNLAGMSIASTSAAAQAFPDLPEATAEADTDSELEEEE